MNLKDAVASAGERAGVIWTLDASSDLNANLVRFGTGQGVGEHVKDEVEDKSTVGALLKSLFGRFLSTSLGE